MEKILFVHVIIRKSAGVHLHLVSHAAPHLRHEPQPRRPVQPEPQLRQLGAGHARHQGRPPPAGRPPVR